MIGTGCEGMASGFVGAGTGRCETLKGGGPAESYQTPESVATMHLASGSQIHGLGDSWDDSFLTDLSSCSFPWPARLWAPSQHTALFSMAVPFSSLPVWPYRPLNQYIVSDT